MQHSRTVQIWVGFFVAVGLAALFMLAMKVSNISALAAQDGYIPDDTSASIYTSGLLGEQYIGLEAGGSEDYLQEGDDFQLTQSAVVLEKLIGQFLVSKADE